MMSELAPVFNPDLAARQPHSCSACQELLITNNSSYCDFAGKFDFGMVVEKASSGCLFFQSILQRFDELMYPSAREHGHLVLFLFSDQGVLTALGLRWSILEVMKSDEGILLHPFASTDHPSAKFVENRPLNLDPGSCENFDWIKDTLEDCLDYDSDCNRAIEENRQRSTIPKRLLNVGESSEQILQLFEASQDAHLNYAIASYAWGTGSQAEPIQQARTTRANIGARMSHGIELTSLPRTVRDLIEVSRRIGYRYLWIDALCIVQDDPIDTSDQVNTMIDFYKGADILISAASASHSDEGFLQPRTVDQSYGNVFELPYLWKLGEHSVQGSLRLSEKDLDCGSDMQSLDMRIWTFQEHLVCSRVISFGPRQVRWKCKELGNLVDGGDYIHYVGGIEDSLDTAFSPRHEEDIVQKNFRVQAWVEIVEHYSSRQYSRPADRIPAFNESISLLAPLLGWDKSDCVEGIWKFDVSRQLLWKKEKPLEVRELEHCRKYGPSWSWATLPGAVIYDHPVMICRDLGDSITSVSFQKHLGEPTCLVLEGYIQEAYWKPHLCSPDKSRTVDQHTLPVKVTWDVEMAPQMVYLLDLSQEWRPPMSLGLVLIQVAGEKILFERRGLFETTSGQQDSDQRVLYSVGGRSLEKVSIV